VIVTDVPPAVVPLVGLTEATAGADAGMVGAAKQRQIGVAGMLEADLQLELLHRCRA